MLFCKDKNESFERLVSCAHKNLFLKRVKYNQICDDIFPINFVSNQSENVKYNLISDVDLCVYSLINMCNMSEVHLNQLLSRVNLSNNLHVVVNRAAESETES